MADTAISIIFDRPFPPDLDDSINQSNTDVILETTFRDGSKLVLDSDVHSVSSIVEKRALPPSPIRRHYHNDWLLFDYQEDGTSSASVSVSWHRDDPTDYLAGGYWMHLHGDFATDSIENAEVEAFVYGPELSNAPDMPTIGSATYRGHAAGLYTFSYGPMWKPLDPRIDDGDKATGEYSGVMTLATDFSAGTVRGCIGCDQNLETTEILVDADGNRSEIYTSLSLASIKFGTTPINSDGTFTGHNLEVVIGGRAVPFHVPVSNVQGSWGGRFSGVPAFDGSGDPRLVAGTTGAQFILEDGSQGEFVGYFFAPKVIAR
ncbi:MAG: hypothetical protein OXI75_10075 [Rhodospirillales bacterium]|nr:hypothetical protein [Rhodospirillales bacterium]